ncbi:MAG: serine/threonine-protein kinase [bacterium]
MKADDLSGATVGGRFECTELLGEGSMGAVYRANDLLTGDVVAVKVMHGFVQKSASFRERFQQEAMALKRLADPGCVRLIESGVDEHTGKLFMAVEFAPGEDLLALRGSLSVPESIEVALRIGEALVAAHSAGILHRDLKPENIKLVRSERGLGVKVLDFGLAKVIDIDPDEDITTTSRRRHLTKAGEILGTPQYMAPELCEAKGDPTPATDLYALGLVLFEMIEGHPAFDGRSPLEILSKQISEPPPALKTDVPADVRNLVAWTLQKDPNDRPQTAEQVVEILERLHHKAATPATPGPAQLSVESPPVRPERAKIWAAALVGIIVLLMLMAWGMR